MTMKKIISFYGFDGYIRETWLRWVPFIELPSYYQGITTKGLWQVGNFHKDDLVWDEVSDNFDTHKVKVLCDNILWHVLESWDYDGLVVHDELLYYEALKLKEAVAAEKLAIANVKEEKQIALNKAAQEELQTLEKRLDKGGALVSYRKGEFNTKNKDGSDEAVTGYIATKDGYDTAFGIDRRGKLWHITHIPTGLLIPDFGIRLRKNALSLIGCFTEIWWDWGHYYAGDILPTAVREESMTLIRKYKAMIED